MAVVSGLFTGHPEPKREISTSQVGRGPLSLAAGCVADCQSGQFLKKGRVVEVSPVLRGDRDGLAGAEALRELRRGRGADQAAETRLRLRREG